MYIDGYLYFSLLWDLEEKNTDSTSIDYNTDVSCIN